MSIHENIKNDLKDAMRAKDSVKTTTLRGLLSGFTNELVSQGKKPDSEVDDETALTVIKRSVKQHKDSIEQYEKGGRDELAESERKELEILNTFLPEQMGEEEIEKIARAKKEELGITEKKDMGRLMGAVMSEVKGAADGGDVKKVVDSLLS